MLGQHHERIPAEASHQIVVADAGTQAGGCGDQHLVAGLVPEGVVDPFEVIEIQEEERDGAIAAPLAATCPSEALRQHGAIRKGRQGIVERLMRKLG